MFLFKCPKCRKPKAVSSDNERFQKISCDCGVMVIDKKRGIRTNLLPGRLNIRIGTNIFPTRKPKVRLRIGG